MRVARVIVDVSARSVDRSFDYAIPKRLEREVRTGVPVLVPFGARSVVGYVVEVPVESTYPSLKEIEAVLGESLFGEHVPGIASWLAEHYVCGLAAGLHPFLPPGGTPKVRRTEEGGYLVERPSVGRVDDRWVVGVPGVDADGALRRGATRQRAVLDAVSSGPVRMAELRAELGDVSSAVGRLKEMGLVEILERRRWRTPAIRQRLAPRPARLTEEQEASLAAIAAAPPGGIVLLDGVTGSGKTEVYLTAIERLTAGRGSAVVLVPEISLTPQTVGRFRARFGERVAVLHSRLSPGERFDQWERARNGSATVLVGPRSALFAPMAQLRIVVIDEEHDASYKQASSPRYHARDVAERLCAATGAVLVLGSATPSLESRDASDRGRVTRVRLTERATGATLPEVTVVDMAREFADGNRSMFSRQLADALGGVEVRQEKAIILLNRRGFASFLLCRECGYVPACDACSVSMTYHQTGQRMICHHCAAVRAVPAKCPECGSPYLRQFGAGTQRVEAELARAFPGLRIVRMDADTTSRKGGHEARLAEFEDLPAGILLGTQMIAKGLDYPDVTLVGVLSADLGLRLPDFRAGERTYQLLEQVAGRAGRADRHGFVVVQTYWPDHPAICAAAAHDPESFYRAERNARRELGYPPFGTLARVLVTGRAHDAVMTVARSLARRLRDRRFDGVSVLGPAPAPLERIKGSLRWHVLLKGARDTDLGALLRDALNHWDDIPAGIAIVPDVDPFDLL